MQSRLESLDKAEIGDRNNFEEAFYVLFAKIHDAAKFVTPAPMARAFIFSPFSSSVHDSDHRACVCLSKLNLPSSPFLEKYDE